LSIEINDKTIILDVWKDDLNQMRVVFISEKDLLDHERIAFQNELKDCLFKYDLYLLNKKLDKPQKGDRNFRLSQ
jgi:hypothetical protein